MDASDFVGLDGVAATLPLRPSRPGRFYCEAGSDQVIMDGCPITHATAEHLVGAWRDQAANYSRSRPNPRLYRLGQDCERAANQLEAALVQARRYQRCMDGPIAFVGLEAFAASLALIDGPEGPAAA